MIRTNEKNRFPHRAYLFRSIQSSNFALRLIFRGQGQTTAGSCSDPCTYSPIYLILTSFTTLTTSFPSRRMTATTIHAPLITMSLTEHPQPGTQEVSERTEGGRSKTREDRHGPRARSVSLSTPTTVSRQSPGRGPHLHIDVGAATQSTRSAPRRVARPLPRVPSAPHPSPSDSNPPTPLTPGPATAPVHGSILHCLTQSSYRVPRPLPCPPFTGNNSSTSPPSTPLRKAMSTSAPTSPPVTPPTERPTRVSKPLPIPVLKVVPARQSGDIPRLSLEARTSLFPEAFTGLDTPPQSAISVTPSDLVFASVTPISDTFGSRLSNGDEDENDLDNLPLQNRIFHTRGQPLMLRHDSDLTSEDDDDDAFAEHTTTSLMPSPSKTERPKSEYEDTVDYAWVLSNRLLHKGKPRENGLASKWVREKKGKRITEDDYANILDALRSL